MPNSVSCILNRAMKIKKIRIDNALVERGYFKTVDEAQRAVMAGLVSAKGIRFAHVGDMVTFDAPLHVKGNRRFASRGGEKLAGALASFGLDVSGKRALDMGCSSGGFTDVLLCLGAASVLAVDVGYAQFAWNLRQDRRVELLERTKGQALLEDAARESSIDVAVCDVSFCSVLDVLDAITYMLVAGGDAILLIKPQFELPKELVGKGGIVNDATLRHRAVLHIEEELQKRGYDLCATSKSVVKGTRGNQEYFVWAKH